MTKVGYRGVLSNTCEVRGCPGVPHSSGLCEKHYWRKYGNKSYKNLYAIFAAPANRVKFGISVDPQRRMASIQTGCPVTLDLLGFVPGGQRLEMAVHNYLSDYNFHGEWFDYVGDVVVVANLIMNESVKELRSLVSKPRVAKTFSEKLAEIASD